jgi:hypothetical protein
VGLLHQIREGDQRNKSRVQREKEGVPGEGGAASGGIGGEEIIEERRDEIAEWVGKGTAVRCSEPIDNQQLGSVQQRQGDSVDLTLFEVAGVHEQTVHQQLLTIAGNGRQHSQEDTIRKRH